MNADAVRLWLAKAGNDLKIGRDEMATKAPATDMVCFHAQQCVEKCLKAYLIHRGVEMPRTHDLSLLLAECIALDPAFEALREANVDRLTDYAVAVRYPDDFYMPGVEEAGVALDAAGRARELVERLVG